MTIMVIKTLVLLASCLVFALCMFLAARSGSSLSAFIFAIIAIIMAIVAIVFAFRI